MSYFRQFYNSSKSEMKIFNVKYPSYIDMEVKLPAMANRNIRHETSPVSIFINLYSLYNVQQQQTKLYNLILIVVRHNNLSIYFWKFGGAIAPVLPPCIRVC